MNELLMTWPCPSQVCRYRFDFEVYGSKPPIRIWNFASLTDRVGWITVSIRDSVSSDGLLQPLSKNSAWLQFRRTGELCR
jgi:hypothetical protein